MEMENVKKLLDQSDPVSKYENESMVYKMISDHNLLSKYSWIIQVGNIPVDQTTWATSSNYELYTNLPNIGLNIRFTKPSKVALNSSFRAFELALVGNNDCSEFDRAYAEGNRALRIKMIGKNELMQISDWKVCTPGFFNFTDGIILENIPTLSVKDNALVDVLIVIIEIAEQSKIKWAMPNLRNGHALLCLGKLYEAREKSGDLELVVKGQKIMAHKHILMGCQVFENMLGVDMKEKQLSQVLIPDFDPVIILELIKYLYTGSVDLEKYALELYKCSDKYAVKELMELCQSYIVFNILNYEWTELFALLQIYGDRIPTVKKTIKDYFESNLIDLRSSEEFELAARQFPEVWNDLYFAK